MFSKHIWLLGSHWSRLCSDWLSDSTLGGDWLYFSPVKNAIRKADWTYRFLKCENIAHIKFSL